MCSRAVWRQQHHRGAIDRALLGPLPCRLRVRGQGHCRATSLRAWRLLPRGLASNAAMHRGPLRERDGADGSRRLPSMSAWRCMQCRCHQARALLTGHLCGKRFKRRLLTVRAAYVPACQRRHQLHALRRWLLLSARHECAHPGFVQCGVISEVGHNLHLTSRLRTVPHRELLRWRPSRTQALRRWHGQ